MVAIEQSSIGHLGSAADSLTKAYISATEAGLDFEAASILQALKLTALTIESLTPARPRACASSPSLRHLAVRFLGDVDIDVSDLHGGES